MLEDHPHRDIGYRAGLLGFGLPRTFVQSGPISVIDVVVRSWGCCSPQGREPLMAERLTQAIAAIRESYEELGVLLAHRADGTPVDDSDIATLDRQAPFAEQCQARGLTLDAATISRLPATRRSSRAPPVSRRAALRPRASWPVG